MSYTVTLKNFDPMIRRITVRAEDGSILARTTSSNIVSVTTDETCVYFEYSFNTGYPPTFDKWAYLQNGYWWGESTDETFYYYDQEDIEIRCDAHADNSSYTAYQMDLLGDFQETEFTDSLGYRQVNCYCYSAESAGYFSAASTTAKGTVMWFSSSDTLDVITPEGTPRSWDGTFSFDGYDSTASCYVAAGSTIYLFMLTSGGSTTSDITATIDFSEAVCLTIQHSGNYGNAYCYVYDENGNVLAEGIGTLTAYMARNSLVELLYTKPRTKNYYYVFTGWYSGSYTAGATPDYENRRTRFYVNGNVTWVARTERSGYQEKFAWTNAKVSGQAFNLTAQEWLGFWKRLEYLANAYLFDFDNAQTNEGVYTGGNFTAAQMNKAFEVFNISDFCKKGDVVYADDLNQLVDRANNLMLS